MHYQNMVFTAQRYTTVHSLSRFSSVDKFNEATVDG